MRAIKSLWCLYHCTLSCFWGILFCSCADDACMFTVQTYPRKGLKQDKRDNKRYMKSCSVRRSFLAGDPSSLKKVISLTHHIPLISATVAVLPTFLPVLVYIPRNYIICSSLQTTSNAFRKILLNRLMHEPL